MRLKTPEVKIGDVKIGGKKTIAIQTMTNVDTSNVKAVVDQCIKLANAGAEMIRIAVDNEASAQKVIDIRKILDKKGYKGIPLIGDFHFNGHILLKKYPDCAASLDKYRINPANAGSDKNFEEFIKIAKKMGKPIRIGVNAGSFNKKVSEKTLVETALNSAKYAEKLGLKRNQIVLSVKTSEINSCIKAYELLEKEMIKNKKVYALHVGLSESGSGLKGIVASTIAMSELLKKGIGDTIRISITNLKNEDRTKEVEICKEILQSLNLRRFKPNIVSCPGCGRTDIKLFQKIVKKINEYIDKNKFKGIENLNIAIMGCVVNGPGEAKNADIGIHLPGKNENGNALIYTKGKFLKTVKKENILEEFIKTFKIKS